jgi:DNA-binding transcriptional regulator YiaG
MEPHEVKALRERYNLSQAEFAKFLTDLDGKNVSRRTVEGWEQVVMGEPFRGISPRNLRKLKIVEASKEGDAIHAMLPNVRGKNR